MLDLNLNQQPGWQSGQRMFIFSFSEDGDSLSQWRAYGSDGGYAIGIHGDHLKAKVEQLGLRFEQCVYNHDAINNPVAQYLDNQLRDGFIARLATAVQPDPGIALLRLLCNGIMRSSIILKGKAFAEEREWRVFPGPAFGATSNFQQEFRIRNGVFVPFTKFPLFPNSKEEANLRISDGSRMSVLQLVIGPTDYKELAGAGLRFMLRGMQDRYHFLGPTHSDASYRNW